MQHRIPAHKLTVLSQQVPISVHEWNDFVYERTPR